MRATTFILPPNPVGAHKVLSGPAWRLIKAHAMAGAKLALTVGNPPKSRKTEAYYHALIGQISDALGASEPSLKNKENAKRILVSAFKIDTRNDVDLSELWDEYEAENEQGMCQGLRGEVVILGGTQTRRFKQKLANAFIDWLYAFAAEHDVEIEERWIDPETGEVTMLKRKV